MIFSAAGPISTMNMLGKIKITSGNRSFTVAFAASSSACWRRAVPKQLVEHFARQPVAFDHAERRVLFAQQLVNHGQQALPRTRVLQKFEFLKIDPGQQFAMYCRLNLLLGAAE